MNGTVTVRLSPVVNCSGLVKARVNGTAHWAFRYTVFTRTSFWSATALSLTILGMSPRVVSDTQSLMALAADAPSEVSTGSTAAPYWAAAVPRNSADGENPMSANSRLATSNTVGSDEVSPSEWSTALAASWEPDTGNPNILSSAAAESGDAPARLRLKAMPMLNGLDTAFPRRCRWKSHPAALTPSTQARVGAAGSAGKRSPAGSDTARLVRFGAPGSAGCLPPAVSTTTESVSAEPHAAENEQSNISSPISFFMPIRRIGIAASSRTDGDTCASCPCGRDSRGWLSPPLGRLLPMDRLLSLQSSSACPGGCPPLVQSVVKLRADGVDEPGEQLIPVVG